METHTTTSSSNGSLPEGGEYPDSSTGLESTQKSSLAYSCAECYRLKLRCDRKIPCGSCVRRGCSRVCPEGTLISTGRGKRSVMPDAPDLTTVITEMGQRIRQLEEALSTSSSNHSLLTHAPPPATSSVPAQHADAQGFFSVNPTGEALYFGPRAGSEVLLSLEGFWRHINPLHGQRSLPGITEFFQFSFCGPPRWDENQAIQQLYLRLPSETRAWSLCRTYFQNGCWIVMPVLQDEAVELLSQVYHSQQAGTSAAHMHPHQLAVVYFLFALGALVDLDLPPDSEQADQYFELACAALSVRSVFENQTVLTVQALTLLANYYAHGGRRYTVEGAWAIISVAMNIAQTLGMRSLGAQPLMTSQFGNPVMRVWINHPSAKGGARYQTISSYSHHM